MKKIIGVLLLLACVLTAVSCKKAEQSIDNTENLPDETVEMNVPTDQEEEGITFVTPYVELTLPSLFDGNVDAKVVSEEPYTLAFVRSDDQTELFTLYFGGETGDVLGTLMLEGQNIVIYVSFAELDETDVNFKQNSRYQEEINTIVGYLVEDGFAAGEAVEYEDTSVFDIKTPVVTLKYPNKWKDKVQVEVSEEKVQFYYNDRLMFEMCFFECDGYILGWYKDTPMYMVHYGPESDEEELMQEDINVIIEHLNEDPDFVSA